MDEEKIEEGLSRAWLPGRFEIVRGHTPIVLDGAHTVRSVTLTLQTFAEIYPGKAHLLFACAADKEVESIAPLFPGHFELVVVTKPGNKKASDIDRADAAFKKAFAEVDGLDYSVNADAERCFGGCFQIVSNAGAQNAT